ncbi:hypothetical protein MW887_008622 [Aspergillus wentii]|nr:hypothetical protein MW887_008622 [Aspergillus wentii]
MDMSSFIVRPPTPPPDSPGGQLDQALAEPSLTVSKIGRFYDQGLYEDEYPWPIDPESQERQQFGHDILLAHFGRRLCHAPISSNPRLVLDIGTGTGCWAFDFG